MRPSDNTTGLQYFVQRGRGTALVAFGALLAACSSLIGVEDLKEGPRPGAEGGSSAAAAGRGGTGGGKGGAAGTGGGSAGNTAASGGSENGGSSGSAGLAGSAAMAGSAGVAAVGGTAGMGGSGGNGGNGGEGTGGDIGGAGMGEGGSGGSTPGDMTVRGRIIDFYRHPIPGVTIDVAGTEVVTNAQGEFVVPDVPATYDASFIVEWSSLRTEIYGWVYQGLTRRDPTLQVYQGLDERSMYTNLRPEGGTPTATQNLSLAIGSPHGSWQAVNIGTGRDAAAFYWIGPTAIAATGHALLWEYDSATDLPTDYVSYDTFTVALDDTATTQAVNINVEPTDITQGNIAGTITAPSSAGPMNAGFLRFTSGATLRLFQESPGPSTFSYLIPSIPNASVTFAASDENPGNSEFALVHRAGIAAGTTDIALEIPATSTLTAPAPGAMVDSTTSFRYQNRQPGVGAAVIRFIDTDFYQGIYVVTSSTNFTIPPVLNGGFTLRAGAEHTWVVQTHGPYANVDAMADENGFMDSFSLDYGASPNGPNTASGTYTQSAGRFFTMAP
jgi:hypothetical protein